MPSAMPCVSWKRFGPLEKSPQKVPMMEFTAWPPSAGRPSTSTTFLPSAAASSAAEMPEMPAPTTQISAAASQEFCLDLRTVRMGISFSYLSATPQLLLVTSTMPRSPSTFTQSPVAITFSGSWSRSVTEGACVTTAPRAILVVISLNTMARGAAPASRATWNWLDQPDEPLAPGNTRTLPAKLLPRSSWRVSITVPVRGSMPPQPEMRSFVTSASPSATPPTTFRPRRTILFESPKFRAPFAGHGGIDAVRGGAEPALHAHDRRQVVRLLRGVDCGNLRALGQHAPQRRAGVRHQVSAGVGDDLRVALAVGELLRRPRREDPQAGVAVHAPALQEAAGFLDLAEGVMRAAEHDVVDVGVLRRRVHLLVGLAQLGFSNLQGFNRLPVPEGSLHRRRLRRESGEVVHLHAAGGGGGRAEVLQPREVGGLAHAGEHRHALLHHLAHVVAEQPPLGSRSHVDVELEQMRAQAVL